MRSTIVKTSFWEDEEFYDLNINSKLVYFYLLTNPMKGVENIFKLNKRMVSVCVGLELQQVELGLKQLIKENYITVHKGYYRLNKDHVQQKKGRFTEEYSKRQLSEIPREIIQVLYQYNTGSVPNIIEIANSNSNNNSNIDRDSNTSLVEEEKPKDKFTEEDVRLCNLFLDLIIEEFPAFSKKTPNKRDFDIMRKIREIDGRKPEEVEFIMRWLRSDDFWKDKVLSISKLRMQFDTLYAQSKRQYDLRNRTQTLKL